MEVKNYNEEHIKDTLKQYYSEGDDALSDRKETYEEALNIWERKYENEDVPDDSIYYPTTRNDAAEIQRSISQVYTDVAEIADVKAKYHGAAAEVGEIAEAQGILFNAKIDDSQHESKSKFLDDVTLQLVKLGGAIGKLHWIKQTEPIYDEVEVVDEDLGVTTERVKVGERVIENRPKKEYINHERLIWDTNANEWADVRWAMEVDIQKTAGQLFEMIETHGFDRKVVREFVEERKKSNSDDSGTSTSKAEGNKTYELREFWGWISLKEGDPEQDFVRIISDKDFKYFFLGPIKHPDNNIYKYLDGEPMIPYQVGYASPREGEIIGDSIILLSKELQQEENCLRNAIRRSAEQDLHAIFGIRKGSGFDANKLQNRESGAIIWTQREPGKDIAEFPHQDTTVSGVRDLELNKRDRQRMYGNTDLNMGIADPSQNDTASGMAMMQNSSNRIKSFFIERFNDSFYNPLAYKILCMSVQYTTESEYQRLGMGLPKSRLLTGATRITIDTSAGSTSDQVRKKKMTENFFLTQQAIQYASKAGLVLPPRMLASPLKILKKLLELNGETASSQYIPDVDELVRVSRAHRQAKQKKIQQAKAAQKERIEYMRQNAEKAGRKQAREALIGE